MKEKLDPDIIRKALQELDPECFKLLYDFWIVDHSIGEIAKDLDINKKELEKRHLDCRKRFLQLINKHEGNS